MLKTLTDEDEADQGAWLSAFWKGERGGVERAQGVTGRDACSPLTLPVSCRFPKAVPGLVVLPVQHLLSFPGFEHHSEQERGEGRPIG